MLERLNSLLLKWFTPGRIPQSEFDRYEERLADIQRSKEKFLQTYIYNLEHPEFKRRYMKEFSQ